MVRARFPGLRLGAGTTFMVDDLNGVHIGLGVYIGSWSEVVVTRSAKQSRIEGGLRIGSGTVVGAWANIRAAGGKVDIGENVLIGQHVSILAANHRRDELGCNPQVGRWDEQRTGVCVGNGAWLGAGAVVLPGVTIGTHSIVAAGAVVTRNIPPGEVWGGIPARRIAPNNRTA